MGDAVMSGEITSEGVILLLAEIEKHRTTGVLHFEAGDLVGEVALVAGQLALEQAELNDGRDPVEVLLALREGQYDVLQRLPALAVSRGDEKAREGSLAVHVPADLMRYCERAGLTGTLVFKRDNRQAETVYDCGELVAIRVDGTEDADLHDVFGWEEGRFEIKAYSIAPSIDVDVEAEDEEEEEDPLEREPTIRIDRRRRKDETGKHFLKVVEVALTSIMEEREKRRSPSRTSPPLPPKPKTQRPDSVSEATQPEPEEKQEAENRREPTVKVIYLGDPEPTEKAEVAGPAKPKVEKKEPKSSQPKGAEGAGVPVADSPAASLAVFGWVALVFVLMAVLLAILARLPSL